MQRFTSLLTLAAALATTATAQVPIVAGDITPRTQIDSVTVDPAKPAAVPLTTVGYQPLVEVNIDGKPAGLFLIATGWARTTILTDAAETLGLTAYDFAEVRDTPHNGRRLFNADTLSFGPVEVALQGLWTEPGIRTVTYADTPLAGILGWDILGSLSFTLSASSAKLQVYPDGIPASVPGTRFPLTEAWSQFPVLQVPGLTGEGTIPLLLDTAVDAPLFLSDATYRSLPNKPTTPVAVKAPGVATGKALELSSVYRAPGDHWAPIAPAGTAVHVGPRPAPLFRFGAVGLIGNATLARSDISLDHDAHTCTIGPPSSKPTPLGALADAGPSAARQLALAFLDPTAASAALAKITTPTFANLGPSVAWLEDDAFPAAVKRTKELTPQQFGDLVDRCSGIDDTTGLQALLDWAKANNLDPNPWLTSTITGAALSGSNGILQAINRELGSIRFVGPDGFSAIHYACSGGHVETIRFCLDAKLSPNLAGPVGLQPIELLGNAGTPEAFDLLTARGASLRKPNAGINIAVSAAENENAPMVKKVIAAGFDPNWTSGDDRVTPLMIAAYNGDTDLVNFLTQNGADPAIKDNNGENALFYCIRGTASAETYKALLDAGTPTDITSFEFGTLPECISAFASPELLALTLAASKEKPTTSPFGRAPVATAARRGHFELIKALVAAGYDPTREDTDGLSPLEWAAVGNHSGIAAYLLSQNDKKPDARDIARSVHLAARWGNGSAFLILSGAATGEDVKSKIDPDRLLEDAILGNHPSVLSLVTAKRLATLPADTTKLAADARAVGAIKTANALTK